MATPTSQQKAAARRQRAAEVAAGVAALRTGTGAAAAVAAPPVITAKVAGEAASKIIGGFVGFLTEQRRRDRRLLTTHLGKRAAGLHSLTRDDLAHVIAQEDLLGREFERRSAERVASAMPAALSLSDPIRRDAAVRTILDSERRFARQRSEAMFVRGSAAIERMHLRQLSPQGVLWRLGVRAIHCPVCRFMGGGVGGRGRFWPWVVIDALHPPVHGQCGCTLHSFGDALANGWMTPADVPDPREALKLAQGVVLPAPIGEALLDELDMRDSLVEAGVDATLLALRPFLAEAFSEGKHPRSHSGPHGGEFIKKLGDVAGEKSRQALAWGARSGMMKDAPPEAEVVRNWTKQLRGRLSKDREAHSIIAAALAENDKIPLWRKIIAKHEPDHVIITTPHVKGKPLRLIDNNDAMVRVAGSTIVTDEAVHLSTTEAPKDPQKEKVAVMSGYGLAAMLRHEYGHSIDGALPKDVRTRIVDLIPDPGADLSYYAGWHHGRGNKGEVIPELLALITHPRYREKDWPETVQKAGRELLKAMGV